MVPKKRARPSAGGAAANKRRKEARQRLSSKERRATLKETPAALKETPDVTRDGKGETVHSAFESLWGAEVPLDGIPDLALLPGDEEGSEGIVEDDASDAEGGSFEELPEEYGEVEAEGDGEQGKRELDSEGVSSLLETGDVRSLVNLFRSCLRGLICVVRSSEKFKQDKLVTKKGQEENEQRKRTVERLERLTEASPFHFKSDVENLANLATQALQKIEASFQQSSKSQMKSNAKYFGSFWADLVIFLENSGGARNQNARVICSSLTSESSMLTLLEHPNLIARFHSKFVQVILRMDSETQEMGLKSLGVFFSALTNKVYGRDAKIQKLIGDCLRRTLTSSAQVTSKRMGGKALGVQRLNVNGLVLIVHKVQLVKPKIIYEVAFTQLRSLVTAAAHLISKEGAKKKGLKMEQLNAEIFSWTTLMVSYLWTSVQMLETAEAMSPKFSLSKQAEGWAVLLMSLCKKCVAHLPSYPFLIKAMANLVSLATASRSHLPLGLMLLQMAHALNKDNSLPSSNDTKNVKLVKAVNVANLLKLEHNELASVRVQEALFSNTLTLILDYLLLLARHPAFPESTFIILTHLKKLAKTNKESSSRMRLKALVTSVEKTARQIETERLDLKIEDLPSSLFVFDDATFSKFDIAQFTRKRMEEKHYMLLE